MPTYRPILLALSLAILFVQSGCLIIDANDDDDRGTDVMVSESIAFSVDVTGQTTFCLEAVSGLVEIAGSRTAQAVRVEGEKRVGSFSRRDAEEHLDDLRIRVTDDNDEIRVRTDQPIDDGRNYVVDYKITLPADLFVLIEMINGNVTLKALEGGIDLDNVNGNVLLDDLVGGAEIDLINGNIDGDVTLPPNHEIDLATTNGNITLEIPRTTSADFSARVTNGTIDLDNLTLQDVEQGDRSLSGRLGGGAGTIELWTVNGNISVRGF